MTKPMKRVSQLATILALLYAANPTEASAQSAWGGGCSSGGGSLDSCIGMIWPTLHADFYIDGPVPDNAFAEVFICITGGSCTQKGYDNLNQGQSSVFTQNVSGSGSAFTRVKVWDASTFYLYATIDSPLQYWDASAHDNEQ